MLRDLSAKIPPTGAKYVIDYKLTSNRTIINSYSYNYLEEVLNRYVLKTDRYKVVIIRHKGTPITVVLRSYKCGSSNTVVDYIQIVTDLTKIMSKSEIKNYINAHNYMELNVV